MEKRPPGESDSSGSDSFHSGGELSVKLIINSLGE
jgi:hypothetical protein